MNKAHKLTVIKHFAPSKPTRAMKEAERKLFKPKGEDSDWLYWVFSLSL